MGARMDGIPYQATREMITEIKIQKVLTATSRQASVIGLAASFLIGLIVAPDLLETFFGGPELIASLDILSDEFLLD